MMMRGRRTHTFFSRTKKTWDQRKPSEICYHKNNKGFRLELILSYSFHFMSCFSIFRINISNNSDFITFCDLRGQETSIKTFAFNYKIRYYAAILWQSKLVAFILTVMIYSVRFLMLLVPHNINITGPGDRWVGWGHPLPQILLHKLTFIKLDVFL